MHRGVLDADEVPELCRTTAKTVDGVESIEGSASLPLDPLNPTALREFTAVALIVGLLAPVACVACLLFPLLSSHAPTGSLVAVAGVVAAASWKSVDPSAASSHKASPEMLLGLKPVALGRRRRGFMGMGTTLLW